MAVCQYCSGGHLSVEEAGLRMHKFSDRWVSCCAGTEEQGTDKSPASMRADLLRLVSAGALVAMRTWVARMPTHFR
jgi:hypothetical protein